MSKVSDEKEGNETRDHMEINVAQNMKTLKTQLYIDNMYIYSFIGL